jgi:hypothetical protein
MKTLSFIGGVTRLVTASIILAGAASAGAAEKHDLAVVGIVAPRVVTLSAEHPRFAKPVTVFIRNRGSVNETIADAQSLAKLVAIDIKPLGGGAELAPELVPPAELPVVVRPGRKIALVYTLALDGEAVTSKQTTFSYSASVNLAALNGSVDLRSRNDVFPHDDTPVLTDVVLAPSFSTPLAEASKETKDAAASEVARARRQARSGIIATRAIMFKRIIADPPKVTIRKGQTRSDPILFTAVFTGGGPRTFVSWDPGDAAEDDEFGVKQEKMRCKWDAAGEHTVEAYIYDLDDPNGIPNAPHMAKTIQVLKVHFEDEMGNDPEGLKLGVTTLNKDRHRTIKAIVEPSSAVDDVMVTISKGASDMTFVGSPFRSGGAVICDIQGVGDTGSDMKGCKVEAKLFGKSVAEANVTVVVPKKVISQSVGAQTAKNELINEGTSPSAPGVSRIEAVRTTRYGWTVTVTVGDQFGNPCGDDKLYRDAPVYEVFAKKGQSFSPKNLAAPININQKLLGDSTYIDPVGLTRYRGFPGPLQRVAFLDPTNLLHINNPNPAFPLENVTAEQSTGDSVFEVRVDSFSLDPPIHREIKLGPGGALTLITTP